VGHGVPALLPAVHKKIERRPYSELSAEVILIGMSALKAIGEGGSATLSTASRYLA
jgi:hypothetical protein